MIEFPYYYIILFLGPLATYAPVYSVDKNQPKTSFGAEFTKCFLEAIPPYGKPLNIESTSFAICCTTMTSLSEEKKNVAVTNNKTINISTMEWDPTDFQVSIN